MRMKKHIIALALSLLALNTLPALAAPGGQTALTQAQIDAARYRSTICARFETLAIKSGNVLGFWGGSKSDGPEIKNLLTNVKKIETPSTWMWLQKTDNSLWAYDYVLMTHPTWKEPSASIAPNKMFDHVVEYASYADTTLAVLSDNSLWRVTWMSLFVHGEGNDPGGNVQIKDGPHKIADNVLHADIADEEYIYMIKDDQALYRWETTGQKMSYESTLYHISALQGEPEKVMDNVAWVDSENRLLITTDNTLWGWGEQDLKDSAQSWSKVDESTGSLYYEKPTPLMADVAKAGDGIALKTDGSIWTWGNTNYGALGNGVATVEHRRRNMKQYEPFQVVAGGGRDVGGTTKHHIYLLSDGSLWGMGDNGLYALGRTGGNFLTTYGDWFQTVPVKIASGCMLPV